MGRPRLASLGQASPDVTSYADLPSNQLSSAQGKFCNPWSARMGSNGYASIFKINLTVFFLPPLRILYAGIWPCTPNAINPHIHPAPRPFPLLLLLVLHSPPPFLSVSHLLPPPLPSLSYTKMRVILKFLSSRLRPQNADDSFPTKQLFVLGTSCGPPRSAKY